MVLSTLERKPHFTRTRGPISSVFFEQFLQRVSASQKFPRAERCEVVPQNAACASRAFYGFGKSHRLWNRLSRIYMETTRYRPPLPRNTIRVCLIGPVGCLG